MLSYRGATLESNGMDTKPPYRLQVFFPEEFRAALRDIAYEERTSIQQLVVRWIIERIRQYPRYADLGTDGGASP